MPLTFPSHAAAVWPLHRAAPRLLPAAALIVGSCTPDLAYLLAGIDGVFTHSLRGTLLFSIPMGLVTLAWLELISPSCKFPRTASGVARATLAIWLGALTHLLWDGFTHRTRWPASVLYPTTHVSLFGASIHLANLLQHASTVAGLAIAIAWARREDLEPPHREALAVPLAAMASGAVIAALIAGGPWHPWSLFWTAARGALIALTVVCLVQRSPAVTPRRR